MLAVAVDNDLVGIDRRQESGDSLLELGRRDGGQGLRDVERRHAYLGQLDRSRHGVSFSYGGS